MENGPTKFTTRVKILACVTSKPSCDDGKAEKTEYECYVCCGGYGDDLPLLKEWLWQCCQTDLDKTHFPADVLDDRNYARAILALRWFHQCFDDDHRVEYIPETSLPTVPPTQATEKYKLWVFPKIQTEASASRPASL